MSNKNALIYTAWIVSVVLALGVGYVASTYQIKEAVKQEVGSSTGTPQSGAQGASSGTTNTPAIGQLTSPAQLEFRATFLGGTVQKVTSDSITIKDTPPPGAPAILGDGIYVIHIDKDTTIRYQLPSKSEPQVVKKNTSEIKLGYFVFAVIKPTPDKNNIVAEQIVYSEKRF